MRRAVVSFVSCVIDFVFLVTELCYLSRKNHFKGVVSRLNGLKKISLDFSILFVCNPCQSSPSLKGLGHAILAISALIGSS